MRPTNQRDYYAEMYVAALLADDLWNVYFPRRDKGFDFIITRETEGGVIVRPVQVKGKFAEPGKGDKPTYGFRGELSLLHREMVLVIPYFESTSARGTPKTVAYMPRGRIATMQRGTYRCEPAKFSQGAVQPRRESARYFDASGLAAMAMHDWE